MNYTYDEICKEIEFSPKNVSLVENLEERFKKVGLEEELIKLYKIAFIYNVEPKYFKKIGDLYNEIGNYEEAINYYLNYCESTKVSSEIYYKLADIFKKNNDLESHRACIEYEKKLELENEK